MFILPVGGLGILGRGALGRTSLEGGVFPSFRLPSSSIVYTGPPPELLPVFRSGVGSHCGGGRFGDQGCHRVSVLGAWLLQPFICSTEGHGWLAASHRSFSAQLLCLTVSLSYGDGAVGPPIPPPWGLDGLFRPSGRLPPGPCPSGLSEISPVLYWPSHIPVSGPLLWSVFCTAGFYSCHGPDLLNYAPPRLQDSSLPRRLARPWILPRGDCAGEGLFIVTLRRTRYLSQSRQEFSHPYSDHRLPRNVSSIHSFEGFPDAGTDPESSLSGLRVPPRPSSRFLSGDPSWESCHL